MLSFEPWWGFNKTARILWGGEPRGFVWIKDPEPPAKKKKKPKPGERVHPIQLRLDPRFPGFAGASDAGFRHLCRSLRRNYYEWIQLPETQAAFHQVCWDNLAKFPKPPAPIMRTPHVSLYQTTRGEDPLYLARITNRPETTQEGSTPRAAVWNLMQSQPRLFPPATLEEAWFSIRIEFSPFPPLEPPVPSGENPDS